MQRSHLGAALVDEATAVVAARAETPLRFLTPTNHGHAAWVYQTTLGGGLVDGDATHLDVEVGQGASLLLSSQGQSRVYRSPAGCRADIVARVGEGALFAYAPDPLACFAQARLAQSLDVELASSASLVVVDVLTAGRVARGERWAFQRFESRLAVRVARTPILDETTLLTTEHGPIAQRFGRFDAMATILLAGPRLQPFIAALRKELERAPLDKDAALVEQSSPREPSALLVRIAGTRIEDVTRAVRARVAFLGGLLGDDPFARRS